MPLQNAIKGKEMFVFCNAMTFNCCHCYEYKACQIFIQTTAAVYIL